MKVKRKYENDESLLFHDFIVEKEASGLLKKSIKNYRDVYDRFTRDIGQPISKNSINNWIHLLLERGMNPISINYYINQIRVFSLKCPFWGSLHTLAFSFAFYFSYA